jgi:hypothetical protein
MKRNWSHDPEVSTSSRFEEIRSTPCKNRRNGEGGGGTTTKRHHSGQTQVPELYQDMFQGLCKLCSGECQFCEQTPPKVGYRGGGTPT